MDSDFKVPASLPIKSCHPPPPQLQPQPERVNEKNTEEEKIIENEPKKPIENELEKQERYNSILSGLNYTTPNGAEVADSRYSLEVLKDGSIVDNVKFLFKSFYIVGRIPACDIVCENPTVSRTHAILQYIGKPTENTDCNEKGFYIFDLGSTHGTFLNKNRLYPKKYYKIHVGHVIKFGNSSRLYIVNGPLDDEEEESEKTVTELIREKNQKEIEKLMRPEKKAEDNDNGNEEEEEDEGIDWGMGNDAEEDTEHTENPFAIDIDEQINFDNPKKTLRGWFDREGFDLNYDVREKANGQFICRIELPLDSQGPAPVFAEVDVKGKKRDAVHQAALKACQMLDKFGVLRKAFHEGRKRKMKSLEDQDYYSSDDDTYLDRTGSIEQKRIQRMKKAGKLDNEKAESYDSLMIKLTQIDSEIDIQTRKIGNAEKIQKEADEEADPLDAFMTGLKTGINDIKKLKSKLKILTEEKSKLQKLAEIAKPSINLPTSAPVSSATTNITKNTTLVRHFEEKPEKVKNDDENDKNDNINKKEKEKPSSESAEEENKKVNFSIKPKESNEKVVLSKSKVSEDLSVEDNPKIPKPKLKPLIKKPISNSSSSSEEEEEEKKKRNKNKKKPFGKKDIEDVNEDEDEEESSASTSKPNANSNKKPKKLKFEDYEAYNDPKYVTWIPKEAETGQTGDGRTKLNDKYGY